MGKNPSKCIRLKDIDMNPTCVAGRDQVKQQAVIFKCFDYCIFIP